MTQNLALTRNALLAVIPFHEKHKLPSLIADYQDDKTSAIHLIPHAKPIPCPLKQHRKTTFNSPFG